MKTKLESIREEHIVFDDSADTWVLNTGKEVKYVLPSSVKEVGYTKQGTFFGCLCQQYNLYYESFTQSTSVMLPVTEESEAQKVVDAFYKAITAAQ